MTHDQAHVRDFARSYTAAWCSHDPAKVAAHYAPAGGTGNAVRISGFEEWTLGDDLLVVEAQGHYDQDEYDRQLEHGLPQS